MSQNLSSKSFGMLLQGCFKSSFSSNQSGLNYFQQIMVRNISSQTEDKVNIFSDIIMSRRSAESFETEPVPNETIELIMKLTQGTPLSLYALINRTLVGGSLLWSCAIFPVTIQWQPSF
mmetsp:Transcript_38082/g.50184  ORF Transcript_38082/g.50184 Transcript_38082/m.50184 type:complete len:119 (+) Transcript_38082:113-469(+)